MNQKTEQIIEEAISKFGLTGNECWDVTNQHYHLVCGSANLFVSTLKLQINNKVETKNVIVFRSPLFRINENMPISFYKEVLDINSDISDGSSLSIDKGYLLMKICIVEEFISTALAFENMNNILYWSDLLDDKLMENYKDSLDKFNFSDYIQNLN